MKPFIVNIIGLSINVHEFDFSLDDKFFEKYGTEMLSEGRFEVKVVLDKHETFIGAEFSIAGHSPLVCDRSLEPFDHPINIHKQVVFKYGDEPSELTDEIIIISREAVSLELGQLMYEFIAIEIPMKKLHPRFRDDEDGSDNSEGKIVYSSESREEKPIDPRWEILKKLK